MGFFRTMVKKILLSDDTEDVNQHSALKLQSFEKATYQKTLSDIEDSFDLVQRSFFQEHIHIIYFDSLVDSQKLEWELLAPLRKTSVNNLEEFFQQSLCKPVFSQQEIINGLLDGYVAMFVGQDGYLINVSGLEERSITESTTETVINGPHDSFNEAIKTNVSLIRRRVRSSRLRMVKLSVGEISKTKVLLIYIEGIADLHIVNDIKKRIHSIKIDSITDSNGLIQLLDDHPNSPFPQFYTTERPDVAVAKLYDGKIIGLVDDSPNIFCTPSSFFDFFKSPDDYNQRWILGTAVRILRYIALIITLVFTAFYVSITTYHYEMIPQSLLQSIMLSRSKVPFPPLIEAIFLELVIELLREAGARLPTKIGQTIGIVGGIVIGQAAVEAGITSNILIIVVAVSAIASFIVPNYLMISSLRIVRFLFIFMAGFLGNIGIVFTLGILSIHLSGLTNLNTPYLMPVSPTFFKDWIDSIVRGPFYKIKKQAALTNKLQNEGEREN